ncbi:ABC transporter ATP-binding protein [Candidatus Woesearchaeota archaeon]|nr:ABC transporter ATP-binding protein [Candidatus Woesearchaeota archaeon]
MKQVIEATNVFKKYPIELMRKKRRQFFKILFDGFPKIEHVQALNGVSLRIQQGECVGIIGPNGSGKSTLLSIIAGILKADSGNIKTKGKIVSLFDTKLGRQEMSADTNRRFLCGLFGMPRKQISKTKSAVFKTAGLSNFADTPMIKYSRGMRDRLMLSLSLSVKPDILLLDEVLSESDEAFRSKFAKAIRKYASSGKTVIMISHELALVEKMCARTIWLDKGTIRMDANTAKVLKTYREASCNATKI